MQRLIRSCRADEEERKITSGSVDDRTVAAAAEKSGAVTGSKSKGRTRDPNLTLSYAVVLAVMVAIAAVLIKFVHKMTK